VLDRPGTAATGSAAADGPPSKRARWRERPAGRWPIMNRQMSLYSLRCDILLAVSDRTRPAVLSISVACKSSCAFIPCVDLLLRPRERLRSIVISMSVCVSVCLAARISPEPHARFLPNFVHVAYVRGSVLLWYVDDRPHCLSTGRGDGSAQRGRSVNLPCYGRPM